MGAKETAKHDAKKKASGLVRIPIWVPEFLAETYRAQSKKDCDDFLEGKLNETRHTIDLDDGDINRNQRSN